MSTSKLYDLWERLFQVAPYLATLILIAVLFLWALHTVRKEIRKELQEIKESLETKIDNERGRDIIRAVINPVIVGLKGIKKISESNAESLEELSKESHETAKAVLRTETNVKSQHQRLTRVEDKVL